MQLVLGYGLALLIGISLGLIGAGGSILTVPVLVYVMGVNPTLATAYSLFIVGITALVGSWDYFRKGLISLKTAFVFAIPAFSSVFLVRRFLIPAIPPKIVQLGTLTLTRDILLMIVFAVLMILASLSMIRNGKGDTRHLPVEDKPPEFNFPLIFGEGIVVGALTGLVGAGGGFLIIPALVVLAGLPMKMAVGTSLLVIAAKSLIGFLGDVQNPELQIDWGLLMLFAGVASIGIFVGSYLSTFISGRKLKKGFGWFVAVMGVYILIKEARGG
ncbi:MAG: sulfite exporter TauE/SafE family protein [Gloeomargarita sp. SKYBB_i_bin120]|nr:sulfite exporter TauE/SafE family protein [Gloeomargarita sp. SKYB120]MDW8177673.1 sulfite exporter TauE/SafE family protein [Gloeomargarita sp. SKYBB_i_bin120]